MTRRIVQIATTDTRVYMLCNDGTAWELANGEFNRIDDIPQDEPAVDPIAEIEAMGGTVQCCLRTSDGKWEMRWFAAAFTGTEPIGEVVTLSDLRAAAARLLERVRGAK